MEIKGKDILILGGWGLVGSAICRKLIEYQPKSITIASLTREQAEEAVKDLKPFARRVKLAAEWGNIFVRTEFKDLSRNDILGDRKRRLTLASDVLERTTATSFGHFFLYDLISRRHPNIVIDCVNTATGVAYQDIYSAGLRVLEMVKGVKADKPAEDFIVEVEKLLDTLYIPQIVRHVQVIYAAMKDAGTTTYVKVGTSGTGGMGLNIPYTHSEDKPSRVLLSKNAIAGAHSLLLFLMGRTPDAPYVKELKPATAIAWKRIEEGEILKGGQPIPLFNCPADKPVKLGKELDLSEAPACKPSGENLKGVFIDTGENGTFSPGEFTAITTIDQMEYITPEEIAEAIAWEIEGGNSGKDIIGALDAAVMTSTYRAGMMRTLAVDKMKKLLKNAPNNPVAFELLGPPRLSKLLYEANLLKQVAKSINGVLRSSPKELSDACLKLIKSDDGLRNRIVSIGIPILLPDGKSLLKSPLVKVPTDPRTKKFAITDANVENWAHNGWVDLRESNMTVWQARFKLLKKQASAHIKGETSSHTIRDEAFWNLNGPLDEGELVGWIFIDEEKGIRMKS
jgi:hypothetical protein